MNKEIITIGFNKDGEADFSISAEIYGFDLKKMNELRAMIPVAIGTAERMFTVAQERNNPAHQAAKSQKHD